MADTGMRQVTQQDVRFARQELMSQGIPAAIKVSSQGNYLYVKPFFRFHQLQAAKALVDAGYRSHESNEQIMPLNQEGADPLEVAPLYMVFCAPERLVLERQGQAQVVLA